MDFIFTPEEASQYLEVPKLRLFHLAGSGYIKFLAYGPGTGKLEEIDPQAFKRTLSTGVDYLYGQDYASTTGPGDCKMGSIPIFKSEEAHGPLILPPDLGYMDDAAGETHEVYIFRRVSNLPLDQLFISIKEIEKVKNEFTLSLRKENVGISKNLSSAENSLMGEEEQIRQKKENMEIFPEITQRKSLGTTEEREKFRIWDEKLCKVAYLGQVRTLATIEFHFVKILYDFYLKGECWVKHKFICEKSLEILPHASKRTINAIFRNKKNGEFLKSLILHEGESYKLNI